jgi:hypothetical protein
MRARLRTRLRREAADQYPDDTITVTFSRRAYSPVLRQSDLRADTTIPWWHNHRLRFQFS